MTPTEHEATVALDAVSRLAYEQGTRDIAAAPPWDDLPPNEQLDVRNRFLPLVWAALEAVPDRAADRQARAEIAADLVRERIASLDAVAERWGAPGGSPRLVRRARDKAEGLATALRIFVEGSHDD